jgi:hypothetical protein
MMPPKMPSLGWVSPGSNKRVQGMEFGPRLVHGIGKKNTVSEFL